MYPYKKMSKFKYILMIGFAGVIVLIGVMWIGGRNDDGNKVGTPPKSELSQLISDGNFKQASEYVNSHDMSKTQEDKLLSYYVALRYDYEKAVEEGSVDYESFQQTLDNTLTSKLPAYTGEFKDDIANFIKTVDMDKTNHNKDIEKETHDKITEMFENHQYDEIQKETIWSKDEDYEAHAMYYFSAALDSQSKNDIEMMKYYLNQIPFDYNGFLFEEIKSQKLSHGTEDQWKYGGKEPVIGMSAEQLKLSRWGEPKDINKTITESNTSEQWVYGNGKYVYLDNGVVTAIQE